MQTAPFSPFLCILSLMRAIKISRSRSASLDSVRSAAGGAAESNGMGVCVHVCAELSADSITSSQRSAIPLHSCWCLVQTIAYTITWRTLMWSSALLGRYTAAAVIGWMIGQPFSGDYLLETQYCQAFLYKYTCVRKYSLNKLENIVTMHVMNIYVIVNIQAISVSMWRQTI